MKLSFTLLAFFILVSVTQAQTHFGIRGGANHSKLNGISTTKGSYDWVSGFHGGLVLITKVGDKVYFQPEVVYAPKGFRYTLNRLEPTVYKDTIRYREEVRIKYIDVPLLARLSLQNVYFEFGPVFSILYDAHRKEIRTTHIAGIEEEHTRTRDVANSMHPVDIGIVTGIGYQNNLGFSLGLRYNQGFQEAMSRNNWHRNILLQLTAAYTLGFKPVDRTTSAKGEVANKGVDYHDPQRGTKKGYRIITKVNVKRVTINKVGDSPKPHIEIHFKSMGSFTPHSVQASGSSGVEDQRDALLTTFRNPTFPFEGSIRYSSSSGTSLAGIESFIEYEITEPGIWRIVVVTE